MPPCRATVSGFGSLALGFSISSMGASCIVRNKKPRVGLIDNINKFFDHRIRLGIMSILVVNDSVDYNRLKELLEVTDGNLASHTKTLEKANYILVEKSFVGRKPNTKYRVTKEGKEAFQKHIEALENLIRGEQ